MALTDTNDRALLGVLAPGLALVERPFAQLAARLGIGEAELIARLERLQADGAIKRFGVVVRHRELGYRANAMVVWALPGHEIGALGRRLAALASVTLCYRRRPCPPDWPYNLYTMIHGRDRAAVRAEIARIIARHGLEHVRHEVLFSRRRFKQCGARYGAPAATTAPALEA